jgi:hypothetical protein
VKSTLSSHSRHGQNSWPLPLPQKSRADWCDLSRAPVFPSGSVCIQGVQGDLLCKQVALGGEVAEVSVASVPHSFNSVDSSHATDMQQDGGPPQGVNEKMIMVTVFFIYHTEH